jgi:hypothetical protein
MLYTVTFVLRLRLAKNIDWTVHIPIAKGFTQRVL